MLNFYEVTIVERVIIAYYGISFALIFVFPFVIGSQVINGSEIFNTKFEIRVAKIALLLELLDIAIVCGIGLVYRTEAPTPFRDFREPVVILVDFILGFMFKFITCRVAFWLLSKRRASKNSNGEFNQNQEALSARVMQASNASSNEMFEELSNPSETLPDTITMEVSTESGLIKDSHKEQQDSEKTVVGCENMTSESVAKETYATSNEPISDALNDTSRGLISSTSEDEKSDNELEIEKIISDSDNSLLRRSMLFIEEKNWKEAEKRIEQELDESPENGEAYLLSLFVETKSTSFNELINKSKNVVPTSKFKFAKRFADDNTNKFIQAIENAALPNNSKNNKKPFKISKLCTALKKNKAVTALIICLAICVCFTGWTSIKLMKMKEERDSYKTIFENTYFDNLVFTFDGDSHYHRYGCPLTPMDSDKTQDYSYSCYDIENAESKGYIPCEYCFDNSNNFDLQDYEDFYVVGNY